MRRLFFAAFVFLSGFLFAQSDDLDSLFPDPSSTEINEAVVIENPENSVFGENKFLWSGDFTSNIGVKASYKDFDSVREDFTNPTERLSVDIGARLWFDARPDKNFRTFGKFTTDYPFNTEVQSEDGQTSLVNNIKVFELFSDFNWKEKVFFRFGKQTTGWGLSRFYQIADPLTIGVKSPTDPSADLEGPVALKVAVPFGVNNLYFYSIVKESYLPENAGEASIRDIGLGVKADFLITVPKNPVLGNGEITFGAFTQRNLAPKAVAGLSTSIGDFQIFSDQSFSWGLDSYRLNNTKVLFPDPDGPGPMNSGFVYDTEKPDEGVNYSATLGTMYVNNDWHFTLYGEYMYNSSASSDNKYLEKWINRYGAETAGLPGTTPTLIMSDIFGYQSKHNSGLSIAWSELFGTDKLGFSAVWLQNWVDMSGMTTPAVQLKPFEHLTIETGVTLVWGKDLGEWVIKNSDFVTQKPQRQTGFISVKIGGGKF